MGEAAHLASDDRVEADVTAYRIRSNSAPRAPKPDAGGEWISADVQVCVTAEPSDLVSVSWRPWVLVYADNTLAQPSSSTYQQFPTPEYPFADHPLALGRCVRGWVTFIGQVGVQPVSVEYQAAGASADWSVQ